MEDVSFSEEESEDKSEDQDENQMTNQEIPDSSESRESSSEDDEVTFKPTAEEKKTKVLLQKCEQAYEQSKNIKDYNYIVEQMHSF